MSNNFSDDVAFNDYIDKTKTKDTETDLNMTPYTKEELRKIFYKDDDSQVLLKGVKYPIIEICENENSIKYAIMMEKRGENTSHFSTSFKIVNLNIGEIEGDFETLDLANSAIHEKINKLILNLNQGDTISIKKLNH